MSASSPFIVPNRINGIDLNGSIQTITDAKKLKDHGFEFAYVASSRYSNTRELSFPKTLDTLRAAGLRVGVYHFCSHDSDPEAQAEFFHRWSGGVGSQPGELPPMVDWEYCTPAKYSPHPQHCVTWAERFMARATNLWYPHNESYHTARFPVFYTYPNYAATHQPALQQSVLGIYPLDYASYSNTPKVLPKAELQSFHKVPLPWAGARLWQYSGNKGLPVPGIAGDCDRQLFNGSRDDWDVFLGLKKAN